MGDICMYIYICIYGSIIGVTKGNTRSLDYSICGKSVSGGPGVITRVRDYAV